MTEQIETEVVNDASISISFSGHEVKLNIAQGLTAWQALGLLKTAESILLAKYQVTGEASPKGE